MVAIGMSLLLEGAALGLFLPSLAQHQPPPALKQSVIKISVQQPPKPPAPKPPPPKPVPPPPKPVPVPPPPKPVPAPALPKPPPVPPPPRPARHVVPRHIVPPRPVAPPPPKPMPVVPPTPPAPVLPPAPSLGQVDAFRLAMRSAVQAVAGEVYPEAAQMAHESGTPEVSFIYRNGVVADIRLAQSSGYPLLDDAAMRAARIAHYPPPPPGFAGRTYTVTVAVIFQMAAPSIDAD
ncbi:MAG: energy transducer TonB [Rhodospirillales bacterium]|nr:energy transducer TonB [Rhodospirillales bacterium]